MNVNSSRQRGMNNSAWEPERESEVWGGKEKFLVLVKKKKKKESVWYFREWDKNNCDERKLNGREGNSASDRVIAVCTKCLEWIQTQNNEYVCAKKIVSVIDSK